MKKKIFATLLTTGIVIGVLTGCGNSGNKAGNDASTQGVTVATASDTDTAAAARTVKIACPQAGVPYGYVDDNGYVTGYDIEVLRLVDEKLPDYAFEFVPTDTQDAWTGAAEGKYQACVTNSFYTAERAEKYIIPETHLGASVGVLIYRKGEGPYKNWQDVADTGASLVPIKAGDGWQFLVEDWNNHNPDHQIKLELTDSTDWLAGLGYVAEGRNDVFGTIKTAWTVNVEAEDGDYHDLYEQLEATEFTSVKTYTLINKDEADLAAKVNDALKELHADGTTASVSEQFYGENVLRYLDN